MMTANIGYCAENSPRLVMNLTAEGLFIDNANTLILQNIFNDYGYNDYILLKNQNYPPVFLQKFPSDFSQIKDENLRNHLFIQILAPLAMLVNERIVLERYELLKLQSRYQKSKIFNDDDKKKLDAWAKKYNVFTRMKNNDRYEVILQNLLNKIDTIPPSIMIAVAAAETNWGMAKELSLANSLYKQKIWYTSEGLRPLKNDDESYRIKIYPTLLAAMEEYALRLNSDVNFENFRVVRRYKRVHQQPLRGASMVYNMVLASPLQNYAGLLSYIIAFYDLGILDEAELGNINTLFNKKEI